MIDFKDKVAIITGAASGIGLGIAEKCIQEGMKVVLADIEQNALAQTTEKLKASGAQVLPVLTDVRKIDDVKTLAQKTLDTFGAIHLFVNNAGVGFAPKSTTNIWEHPLPDWEWILGVNVMGVIHGINVFVPIMLKQDNECYIVNTASIVGLMSPVLGGGIYSITKHAVIALSESLDQELKRSGSKIKVVALCPGFVATNLLESERNRPEEFEYEIKRNQEFEPIIKAYEQSVENGILPQEVAEKLFKAIKDGKKFYIPTDHLVFLRKNVKIRMEAILKDLQKD